MSELTPLSEHETEPPSSRSWLDEFYDIPDDEYLALTGYYYDQQSEDDRAYDVLVRSQQQTRPVPLEETIPLEQSRERWTIRMGQKVTAMFRKSDSQPV